MNFLKAFIEECRYYDSSVEINAIKKGISLKGKTLIDLGAGIGRLAFPLSRYAKKVIAVDKDKRFRKCFGKNKKVIFVNQKIEKFIKNYKNVNEETIFLLAWPTLSVKFLDLIKKAMQKNQGSEMVFITCDNNSEYEMIPDNFAGKNKFKKDIANKEKFLKLIEKKFKAIVKKKVPTEYHFPNEEIAFGILKNNLQLWYGIKLDKKGELKLREIIKRYKKGPRILIKEEIWFYLLR